MNTELNFPRRLLVAVVSQNNIGSLRRQLQRRVFSQTAAAAGH